MSLQVTTSDRDQTLTPNPNVIYLMPFFNTQDGPVVLEVPPADQGVLNGSIMNRWQAAIARQDYAPGCRLPAEVRAPFMLNGRKQRMDGRRPQARQYLARRGLSWR